MRCDDRSLASTLIALAVAGAGTAQPLPDQFARPVRETVASGRQDRDGALPAGARGADRAQTRTLKLGANGELDVCATSPATSSSRAAAAARRRSRSSRPRERRPPTRRASDARPRAGRRSPSAHGRAEVQTRLPERRRAAPQQPPQRQRLGRLHDRRARRHPRITIDSISGNIRVTRHQGRPHARVGQRQRHIASAGRIAAAKTISGNVEIADTQIDGALEAAERQRQRACCARSRRARSTLGTVSGNVDLEDVECERVEAQSVSGNVEFAGPWPERPLRAQLALRRRPPRLVGANRLRARGQLVQRLDPLRSAADRCRAATAADRGGRRALRGVYGDGSAVLDLTTFSGTIVITKR